jgi:repressor LexA
LREYYRAQTRLPSLGELAELLGYQSKGAVAYVVDGLLERGIVAKDAKGKLLPTAHLKPSIRLLGSVQAGFPSPAEEELIDTLSLDEFLVKKPTATYLVKVSGDSMIDAGIHPNDLVLVERGRIPKSGDIVIACVDGEWTMKFYIKKTGTVSLRPANKKYRDIIPRDELEIGGVVIGCIRKYT